VITPEAVDEVWRVTRVRARLRSWNSCAERGAARAISSTVSYFIPEAPGEMERLANEAAISRLYAGVRHRFDDDAGRSLGRRIGRYAIAQDGSVSIQLFPLPS
jgi:hypothetical protein